jgi:hypothetical protein
VSNKQDPAPASKESSTQSEPSAQSVPRRSERVRHDYAKLSSKGWGSVNSFLYASIAVAGHTSLRRALDKDRSGESLKSLHREVKSLLEQHKPLLQVKCEDIPDHHLSKVIPKHCFVKEKFTPTGKFIKVKSRIVAGGDK